MPRHRRGGWRSMAKQWRSQLGATAVEYALMVGLIAVVVLGAVATLGESIFGDDVEVLGNVLTRDCHLAEHEKASETAKKAVCGE
jgi:Flp pilus assembly pilin Flp